MLEWFLSSAVLTLIVILLRLLLKGKISLRLQYALWALVLVRLLVPVSIGSTSFSIGNLSQRAAGTEVGQKVTELSDAKLPGKSYQAAYDEVAREYAERGTDISALPAAEFSETVDYEIHSRMNSTWSVRDVLLAVWIAGAAVVGLVLLASNLRFAAKLKKTRKRLAGQTGTLPVYVSEAAETPCLLGVFRPKIYLMGEATANETILRHSIEHETTHYRHGDHIWAILRGVCLALHWFDPLVWWAAVLSRNDAELACDEATIRRLGEQERAEYGRTLIQMTCQKPPALLLVATTMTGSKNSIKERIWMIAKKPKAAIYTLIAVLLIVSVAAGCAFTGAQENEKPDDTQPSEAVTTEATTTAATTTTPATTTEPPATTEATTTYTSFIDYAGVMRYLDADGKEPGVVYVTYYTDEYGKTDWVDENGKNPPKAYDSPAERAQRFLDTKERAYNYYDSWMESQENLLRIVQEIESTRNVDELVGGEIENYEDCLHDLAFIKKYIEGKQEVLSKGNSKIWELLYGNIHSEYRQIVRLERKLDIWENPNSRYSKTLYDEDMNGNLKGTPESTREYIKECEERIAFCEHCIEMYEQGAMELTVVSYYFANKP